MQDLTTLTVDQLKAEFARLEAEYNAATAKVRKLRAYDRVVNEGGEGFSSAEAASQRVYEEFGPQLNAINKELFAREWTLEVFNGRRAAWNAEVKVWVDAKRNPSTKDLLALQDRLGYSLGDMRAAKALLGVN